MIDVTEGWVSPIEIFSNEIITKFSEAADDNIQQLIEIELGAKIDRDELIKAMNYDREQYKKGYQNGYKKRDKEIIRCENCKHSIKKDYGEVIPYEYLCVLKSTVTHLEEHEANYFCASGERKTE